MLTDSSQICNLFEHSIVSKRPLKRYSKILRLVHGHFLGLWLCQIAIRTDQSSNTLEMTMYFNNEDFEPGWCLSWGLCLLTSWPSSWRRRRVRPRSRRRTCTSCSSRHRSARRRRQKIERYMTGMRWLSKYHPLNKQFMSVHFLSFIPLWRVYLRE